MAVALLLCYEQIPHVFLSLRDTFVMWNKDRDDFTTSQSALMGWISSARHMEAFLEALGLLVLMQLIRNLPARVQPIYNRIGSTEPSQALFTGTFQRTSGGWIRTRRSQLLFCLRLFLFTIEWK